LHFNFDAAMRAMGLIITLIAGIMGLVACISPAMAQETTTPTPASPAVTATVDRLAAPPTVTSPTQADDGAQLYWLNCQPCHGDQGQGLTDEWRAQYPPEDQNCWARGCHGNVPYENGFKLPKTVPAVIGDGTLEKFETLGQLYVFIQAAMPFEAPGNLSEEEYLAITAFLARAHDLGNGARLDVNNVHEVRFNRLPPYVADTAIAPQEIEESMAESVQEPKDDNQVEMSQSGILILAGSLVLILLLVGGAWIWQRRDH
jgi:cytochrome c